MTLGPLIRKTGFVVRMVSRRTQRKIRETGGWNWNFIPANGWLITNEEERVSFQIKTVA